MSTAPAFTVAICTHNHADRLARTLADLPAVRASDAAWELLIVDNASTDGTADLLVRHAWPAGWQVRLVREEKLGIAQARNRAVEESQGEFLVFMDDDETADPDWLRAFERVVRRHTPDAVGGRISVLFEDPRPAWLADELLGFLGQLDWGIQTKQLRDPDTPLFTGNFGFRKSICRDIGGFDVALGRRGSANFGGEDVDFYRRLLQAGYKVWWVPDAVIHHRIQAAKLKRSYFLDLHYRQGRIQGARARADQSRLPPQYLLPQAARAYGRAVVKRLREGSDQSLRLEMNAAYFTGYLLGWMRDPR
jgi:GT2 family glycosyltransferase